MPRSEPPVESLLPLTPVVLELLLSLADGERHGYAILLDVEERTGGRLRLLPGSLYRALHRLREQGLVEESDARATDERRQIFRLTPRGRAVAVAEARRLEDTVATARARRLLPREAR
ncbi:MAG: helix-turn-helix transcriptional regulator [Acidobacteria bacterium]|nr:helix-turn-helix transcriptional regulator [Acidobacteriota bacterium]